jgi:hypothetical protein
MGRVIHIDNGFIQARGDDALSDKFELLSSNRSQSRSRSILTNKFVRHTSHLGPNSNALRSRGNSMSMLSPQ